MKQQSEASDLLSPERPAKLLSDLVHLVAERVPAEQELPSVYASRQAAILKQSEQAQAHLLETYQEQRATIDSQYQAAVRRTEETYAADRAATERQYAASRSEILRRFTEAEAAAKRAHQEAHWEAATIFEATKDGPGKQYAEIEGQADVWRNELDSIQQQAVAILQRRWQWRNYARPETEEAPANDISLEGLAELIAEARQSYRDLAGQGVPAMFEGWRPFWLVVLLWLASIVPAMLLTGWTGWYWLAASAGLAAILAVVLGRWLFGIARRQSEEAFLELRIAVAAAQRGRQRLLQKAKAEADAQYAAIERRRDEGFRQADAALAARTEEITFRRQADLDRLTKVRAARLEEITERRNRELAEANGRYPKVVNEVEESFQRETERLKVVGQRAALDSDQLFQRRWRELADNWRAGIETFQGSLAEMHHACDGLFPDWNTTDWDAWAPPADHLPPIHLGDYRVELARIPGGVPQDERLCPKQTEFGLPALLPFPQRSVLLLKAEGEGRAAAVQILQSVMLRMLTSLPPGKVRFTILDPVGLGENFSAFMHLADYNEQLVANRIWTDAVHIPQRLADLTGHMESVLQVYLRNEFESIHQYNAAAGEMAEPYRVLVVANFPANFTEEAARRLTSIVASGARCGVFTLMSVDKNMPLPPGFTLADLEPYAMSLTWRDGRFVGSHPEYGDLSLTPQRPPSPEKFTEIIRAIGRKVPDAGRVEVPFTHVAPVDGEHWSASTASGIDVPLGRAGAMKLQNLRLGRGTSQHVLIAGKTGSGKSTLLHVIITNLALRYSPDEVEFYLVDFKKGVEFKTYATNSLPHARVVAVESEREFGLSVLERLDAELRRRGDLFRRLGVQDLAGFRAAQPEAKLPRVLLIVDEFQELFVEDDRISQNAALLLDRLVRQGRAFGIHVLLGSQTLGGAYSLARSTIGQMAVRIALQCSEADAHLILSEENSGARLLSRPGEAIYNDANGLYEGNHPFQAAWLSDHERDRYLDDVARLARERHCEFPPPVVFEGNVSADVHENAELAELLRSPAWDQSPRMARAWLGAAVSIKEPTAATFTRQSGNNLLVVGQRDESALGVLATALVSLAAQCPPPDSRGETPRPHFYLLDGTRPEAPESGYWNRIAESLPHPIRIAGLREAAECVAELAEEVQRREQSGAEDAPPLFLFIYDLGRFRDLRRGDDDFGFSGFGEEKQTSPAQHFTRILRDGPAVGIHGLIWCDTMNNVARWLDRQTLRDMELRVAFQMNSNDSSSLIDSPAAGRLGVHRAILYHEGQGWHEKFRPYAPPPQDWLDRVRQELQQFLANRAMA